MPGGEGMAPFTQLRQGDVKREKPEGLRILKRASIDIRQDGDGGRGRGGGGRGGGGRGGGGGGDGDNNGGGRGRGGGGGGRGRGGNNDDEDDDTGDGRGGGRGRGGNRGGGGFAGGGGGGGGGRGRGGGGGGNETDSEPDSPTPTAEAPQSETPAPTSAPPAVAPSATTAPVAESAPPPAPTTIVQVSTMTITPSVGTPEVVTTFIPLMAGSTEPVAAVEGSTDTASEPSNTDSALMSSPTPTALPDQVTAPLAFSPSPSATTVDTGSLGIGDPPSTTPRAPAASDTPQGMDPMAERAMISVGSIAAFVMVISICWMIYRRMKRKRETGGNGSSSSIFRRILPPRLAMRLPFSQEASESKESFSKDRAWENVGETVSIKDRPPTYSSGKAGGAKSLPLGGFYGHEKSYPYQPPDDKSGKKDEKPLLPRLKTTGIPTVTQVSSQSSASPGPLSSHPISAVRVGKGDVSANTTTPSTVILFSHQTQESFSSTNAAHFGSITTTSSASTLRSKMGPVHYNQSEMARTPSAAYDPGRRQVNRASELSSISSGFGDGDIIVTTDPTIPVPKIPANVHPAAPANNNARFSWMSQEPNKRDTVYTQSSEDMPPRFRSVNSWVDQQTGRIKRAQQREQAQPPVPQVLGYAGVPGIHNPPNEQNYDLMMDDEQPRRVEDMMPSARG